MTVYSLAPLASILIYGVLLYHALHLRRRRERLAFTYYLAAAGGWNLTSFVLHIDEPFLNRYALVESRLLIVAFILMVVAYYSFLRAYVGRDKGPGLYVAIASVPLLGVLEGPSSLLREKGLLKPLQVLGRTVEACGQFPQFVSIWHIYRL